ncbi:hypothetical protein HanRHA438_Chr02g0090851 [Helianthus annuus]|nr:hypothetical protein HanRHA438_Chr02g0090851 [Helianthus annuus]
MNIFRTSIAMMKRRGEMGSPCRRPLLKENSPEGDPLISTEPFPEDRHPFIQSTHLSGKAIYFSV